MIEKDYFISHGFSEFKNDNGFPCYVKNTDNESITYRIDNRYLKIFKYNVNNDITEFLGRCEDIDYFEKICKLCNVDI